MVSVATIAVDDVRLRFLAAVTQPGLESNISRLEERLGSVKKRAIVVPRDEQLGELEPLGINAGRQNLVDLESEYLTLVQA